MSLRELVRDLMWARARVLIEGGWRTRPAWRYIRALEAEIPIPDELRARMRGHYTDREYQREVMQEPVPIRVADMDGDEHSTEPGACSCRDVCRECGGRCHTQGIYGGLMRLCEDCPVDSGYWHAPGASID